MRIIFHIGMGKTGTTSIQQALAHNAEALETQGAHYLGMWFDAANPTFDGLAGFGQFLAQSPKDQKLCAKRFCTHASQISDEKKVHTFILSNESLFHNGKRLEPFLRGLEANGAKVEFLAYLRDPRVWLPSAHTQWALRHKTNKGRLEGFETSARRLIKFYEGLAFWIEQFGTATQVREANVESDVVADFATTIGLQLNPLPSRALERSEPADTLMRAMFNNRVHEQVLPDRFNRMVRDTEAKKVPSSQEIAHVCFDHSATEDVIAENLETFEFIRDRAGIDFVNRPIVQEALPDESELQRRVIDYLIELTFDQAQRLKRLEHIVENLRKK